MGRVFRVQKIPEFKRDLKRLSKRFPTLEEDLQILIGSSLELYTISIWIMVALRL